MNYLIVGGTSLFGAGLAECLQSRDSSAVITATKLPTEQALPLAGVTWADVDVLDTLSIIDTLNACHPDMVFNLAVQNSVGYAWSNPGATVDVNVTGALNLMDAVRQLDYQPVVVLAGSGEEYGRMPFDELPLAEDAKPNPGNIFAASKVCQTMMAKIYRRAYNMRLIVLRTFNEIGPGQSARFVVSNFCRQFALIEAGKAEPVIHTGNVNIERDFTDVRDLVRAFALVAEKGRPGEVYNAGRGHAVPIREVLGMLEQLTHLKVELHADADRIRPIDTPKFEADTTKITADTGWQAEIPLEQTVEDMLNYWRQRV